MCKAEIAVRQLTVDYVNQSELQTSRGRYEHPDYADELGGLNHRWLSLQGTLNNQVRTQLGKEKIAYRTSTYG